MNMRAVFKNEDGTETVYKGDRAWAALIAFRRPYNGVPKMPPLLPIAPKRKKAKAYAGVPVLNQLPASKLNYKVKNAAGGRKAMFSQSREYKLSMAPCAMPWYGWQEYSDLLNECKAAREELDQAIRSNGHAVNDTYN